MKKLRQCLAIVLALIFSLAADAAFGGNRALDAAKSAPFVKGELLVGFKGHVGAAGRARKHKKLRSSKVRRLKHAGVDHIRLERGLSVEDAIARYQADPDVLFAEPNYIWTAFAAPNDPRFGEMWNLHNTQQGGGTMDADIDAPEAWDLANGSHDVVVAVIDSGVDYNHEDLAANMWRNPGEIAGNGIDDDGNGYVDDVHGWNAVTCADLTPEGVCRSYRLPDGDPMDTYSHGTTVAGVIGAVGNNDLGIAGVNWNVGIMACRWLNENGDGLSSDALACLDYVRTMKDRNVNVVATNNSWGGGKYSEALHRAIAEQGEILFVAAAGNSGIDLDESPIYPASYPLPNVISVAATDKEDDLAYMLNLKNSNFGRRTVQVGAPGAGIHTTFPGGAYNPTTGTSVAAPHVSGLAALLKAQNPDRGWKEIKNLILAGGDRVTSLAGVTVTGRRMNAHGSLACDGRTVFSILDYPRSYSTGAPVPLSALSIDCESPVGPVTMLTSAGEEATLVDDGTPPDAAAGDGVFSASWTPALDYHSLTFSSGAGGETVLVPPAILSAASLPPARVYTSYSQFLAAAGGLPPYTWSIRSGSLPSGLNLDGATGRIYGTPDTVGFFSFEIEVEDAQQSSTTMTMSLSVSNGADLVVTALAGADSLSAGVGTWVDVTIRNQGTAAAVQSEVAIALAAGPDGPGECMSYYVVGPLSAGQQSTLRVSYQVRAACAGDRYWVAMADYPPRVTETDEDNNFRAGNPVTVLAADYELVQGSVSGPAAINGSQPFTTSVVVRNAGNAVADPAPVYVKLSVSPYYLGIPTGGDLGYGWTSALNPGQEQTIEVSCVVPSLAPPGTYHLWAKMNPNPSPLKPEIDSENNDASGNRFEYTKDVLPQAGFTGNPTSGVAPLAVDFADASTGGAPKSWTWSFGDGSAESNAQHPSHTYLYPGTYTVVLTVANGAGTDTETRIDYITVEVPPNVPVADAGPDRTGEAGSAVRFDGRGSTDDQGIALFEWDFDSDGTVDSTKARAAYVYQSAGAYVATLMVTDLEGLQDSDSAVVTILPATDSPPVANAGPDQVVSDGDTVTFDGTASFDDVGITRYLWDFESDGVYDAQGMIATHVYPGPGNYTATLHVSDSRRHGDEDTVAITVLGPPQGNTIAITQARYVSRKKLLEVEATSSYGADAALAAEGYGPLTWNAATNVWEERFYEPAGAPATVTVIGPEGSATADVTVSSK